MNFDFIFMLTKNDKTIPDALSKVKEVLAGGAKHIGFKDIGLPFVELKILAKLIKDSGATLYLEVVSLDEESEIRSAKAALELDVDYLMGGTRPDLIAPIVKDHKLKYFPFPGKIVGHPSILLGPIDDIVDSGLRMATIDGVDGLDLLAYRFEGDVPSLIRSLCSKSSKPVVIAGSIDSEYRMRVAYEAGAAGFTVGTAAFEEVFPADSRGLESQVRFIAEACQRLVTEQTQIELT